MGIVNQVNLVFHNIPEIVFLSVPSIYTDMIYLDFGIMHSLSITTLKKYENMLSNEFGKKAVARNQEVLKITLKRDYV